ncbi:hypothetical protein BX616_004393, partial [Lobosporangium transversale]
GIIAQSDPIDIPFNPPSSAAENTNYFMNVLGCNATDITCVRSKPTSDIVEAQIATNKKALEERKWSTEALIQRPTVDGQLIPAEFSQLVKTGKYNTKANIMWSTTKDEAGLFIPRYFPEPVPPANASSALECVFESDRAAKLLASKYFQLDPNDPDAVRNLFTRTGTQYYFFCPLRYISNQIAKNKKIYKFRFNRGRDTPFATASYCSSSTGRVCHAADIQSTFASGAAFPGYVQEGDDARFARQVVDRFTAFAKTGDPNPKSDLQGFEATNPDVTKVNWIPYDDTHPVLELNLKSSMSRNSEKNVCTWLETEFLFDFWLRISGNMP